MTRCHDACHQEDRRGNDGCDLHGVDEGGLSVCHQLGLCGVSRIDDARQGCQRLLSGVDHPTRKTREGRPEHEPVADVLGRSQHGDSQGDTELKAGL
jgi:hypothetical protein